MIITLNGNGVSLKDLSDIAAGAAQVTLCDDALARMAKTRQVIDDAVKNRTPVYGVTTGLGPKAVEALPEEDLAAFALTTVRGRAHSAGADLSETQCRAALTIRLSTLLTGAAGVRPELAVFIADCLNAGLAPAIRSVGSIGAADLMWGGDMGLALIGEGRMWVDGAVLGAGDALARANLPPWRPAPAKVWRWLAILQPPLLWRCSPATSCRQFWTPRTAHWR